MTVEIFLLVPVPFVPLRIKERCSLRQHLTNLTIFFCTMISRDFVVMIFWRNCTEWSRFSAVELTGQFYDAIRKSKHSAEPFEFEFWKIKLKMFQRKSWFYLKVWNCEPLLAFCISFTKIEILCTEGHRLTRQLNVFPGSKLETWNSFMNIR